MKILLSIKKVSIDKRRPFLALIVAPIYLELTPYHNAFTHLQIMDIFKYGSENKLTWQNTPISVRSGFVLLLANFIK